MTPDRNTGRVSVGTPDEVGILKHSESRAVGKDHRSVYVRAEARGFEIAIRVPDVPALIDQLRDAEEWRRFRRR